MPSTAAVCRVALVGTVILLVVVAYYPFAWDPPHTVRNDVTRSADGSLRFGEMNRARTPGTPAWLGASRISGAGQVQLEFDPQSLKEQASIMMLASDSWNTDIAIGQDHADLVVWLRRPGSDANGDPPFVVARAIQPQRWTKVVVLLLRHSIRINVNGTVRLNEPLPADSLRVWGQGQIALGSEVHGGGPWRGSIRHAEVRAAGYAVDYVRPGALSIPETFFYFPDHVEPFPPTNLEQWLLALFDLLSFIPVGFLMVLARRPPMRPAAASLLAVALAVVLAAGKFLFHARHTSVANVVMQAAGACLGAWLASWLVHAKRSDGWVRGDVSSRSMVTRGSRTY